MEIEELAHDLHGVNASTMSQPHARSLERRRHQRYQLALLLHYRVALKGLPPRVGASLTCDMSTNGVSFRCPRPLPLGAHVEMEIDWPALYAEVYPIHLQVTGFVVRCHAGIAAVSISSLRFRTGATPLEPVSAIA